MTVKSHTTAIGSFVVGAIVLFIAAILLFAKVQFAQPVSSYVLFFDGSVAGLDTGAPVVFQGVKIGQVTKVEVLADFDKLDIYIPVYVVIFPDKIRMLDPKAVRKNYAQPLIDKGLRASLEMQSLVTGKLMVALSFKPEVPLDYKGILPDINEIPTAPTTISQITEKLKNLPISEIADTTLSLVTHLDELASSDNLGQSLEDLKQTIAVYKTLGENLNKEIPATAQGITQVTGQLTGTLDEFELTLKNVNEALNGLSEAYGSESEVEYQLTLVMAEFAKAARSMRLMTETLERQPEALIYGKEKVAP